MDPKFFGSLSEAEAVEFLNDFLETQREAVQETINAARSEGIHADLTVESAPGFLKWVVPKLSTVALLPDETVPSWIRETDSYTSSLFDFDEPSKTVILSAGYYLGQSFVNYSDRLSWAVGEARRIKNAKSAKHNMPVVTGFSLDLELAPILVVENLFRRITRKAAGGEAIDQAVKYWLDKVPEQIQ